MHDDTGFERQIGVVLDRMGGPASTFDAMAIARTAAVPAPQWRLQSMFGATKFVVAGATVALFGGLLLAGVLTTQPSEEQMPAVGASASAEATPTDATAEPQPTLEPDRTETPATTTPSDILPGVDLVTEEVEPGVYRVVNDGVRDLVAEPPRVLALAPGGDVILFTEANGESGVLQRFYTLGERGEEVLGADGGDIYWFDAALDDAGNLIARLDDDTFDSGFGRFGYFDGDTWTEPTWPNGSAKVSAVELAPDGAAWVTRASTGPWPRVARIEDGDWTVLPMIDDGSSGRYLGGPNNFAVAPDGTVWFASSGEGSGDLPKDTKGLLHFDGQRWLVPELPIEPAIDQFGPLAIGPDGTLWVYATEGPFSNLPHLLRLRDGEWTVFTEADGVPHLVGFQTFGARLAVDGAGTLWIAIDGDPVGLDTLPPPLGPSDPPHGVLSFDGSTWRQYLKGQHVNRVEIADDDSVWATSLRDCTDKPGDECGGAWNGGLYVITPEAVAATG
jgi:hypothetical protein